VAQDTHIPEFAVMAMPAQATGGQAYRWRTSSPRSLVPSPLPLAGEGEGRSGEKENYQDSLAPVRPIRLFERPERIEAIAEVPDGPPVQFIWRQVRHVIAHAEGPERIAMEWWRDERGHALTRDYFRVESREGVRVWLYREGLYGRGTKPNWFLHGVFA
jgi:protein ImuB